MPTPETMRTNMMVDQICRLWPPGRRRFTGGGSFDGRGADTRGATTGGPVGEVRKGFPSSRRSSTDKTGLAKIFLAAGATLATAYTALLRGMSRERQTALPVTSTRGGGALGRNRLGGGFRRAGLYRRRIPSAGGRCHIDGVVGLGLRRGGLGRGVWRGK